MTPAPDRHVIPGSERIALTGAREVGAAPSDERLEATLQLRPAAFLTAATSGGAFGGQLPHARHYLTREAYASQHGATDADIARVGAFAQAHRLVVVQSDAGRRSVVLSGKVHDMEAAFGVALKQFEHAGGTYRGRVGTISVPADLAGVVEGVFGLDDRPQATPHFQVLGRTESIAAHAVDAAFTPPQLAALYQFPTGLDGSGQCIGLIELGGGYKPADLTTYFGGLGLPVPKVRSVRVDGGRNHPTNAQSADGEVLLDIEVAAALAPKAAIVVYFAPNTDQGFLDAVTTAVHDAVHKPSVISISWGSAESNWTAQSMTQFDQAFQAAAAMGVTICCAAGDAGSGDGVKDGKPHVDFPASSPYVLGCGGTKLSAAGTTRSAEVVWNEGPDSATGGGISGHFPLPAYQRDAKLPALAGARGRGVPDVAGDADPASGYRVRVDGQDMVIGGTSAVAPLWAGLIALLNQRLQQPVGFLNPLLYGSLVADKVFNDITVGNNGAFNAAAGWDACTGWGSPNGSRLLAALAGTPQA